MRAEKFPLVLIGGRADCADTGASTPLGAACYFLTFGQMKAEA